MPHLVELVQFSRPDPGSFVASIESAVREARRRGWEASVVLPAAAAEVPWLGRLRNAGAELLLAPDGGAVGDTRWLASRLFEGPLVMHTHFRRWDLPSAVLAAGRRDHYAFWHVHSTLDAAPLVWVRNLVKYGMLGRGVSAMLCPSQNIVDGLVHRGVSRRRATFFPSAIDTDDFPLPGDEGYEAQRRVARQAYGAGPEDLVLLHFGWNWHLKGTDALLETIARLASEQGRRVVALECGGGEEVNRAARELGISDSVRVTGPVARPQELFAAADILLSTSRSEGMAYAVLEALASGVPVVATPIPGHTFIADRVDACRIAERSAPDLVKAIDEVTARDSATAAAESRAARQWVEAEMSTTVAANRLLDIFEAAAGAPS